MWNRQRTLVLLDPSSLVAQSSHDDLDQVLDPAVPHSQLLRCDGRPVDAVNILHRLDESFLSCTNRNRCQSTDAKARGYKGERQLTRLLMYHAQISPLKGQLRMARKTSRRMMSSIRRFLFWQHAERRSATRSQSDGTGWTDEVRDVAQPEGLESRDVSDERSVRDRSSVHGLHSDPIRLLGLELPGDIGRVNSQTALGIRHL